MTQQGYNKFYLPRWGDSDNTDLILSLMIARNKLLMLRNYYLPDTDKQWTNLDFSNYYTFKQHFKQFITNTITEARNRGVLSVTARSLISGVYPAPQPGGRCLSIQFLEPPLGKSKISVDTINQVITLAIGKDQQNPQVQDLLLVVSAPLSTSAREKIDMCSMNINIVHDDNFVLSPHEHLLNPVYREMSQEEKANFFKQSGLGQSGISSIPANDPVIRNYGFGVGSLIEITRTNYFSSSIGKVSVGYRIVTKKRD